MVSLPPTVSVSANTIIAWWDQGITSAIIAPNPSYEKSLALGPGLYVADIIAMVDGDPEQRVERQFTVGVKADDLQWASD